MNPCKNMLLRWHTESANLQIDRILYINIVEEIIVIDIFDEKALPVIQCYNDIINSIGQCDITVELVDPYAHINVQPEPPSDINIKNYQQWNTKYQKNLERRNRAWEIIAPLVQDTSIFNADERGKLILKRAVAYTTTHTMIYRYLRRYWQRGMLKNALFPLYTNSGGKGKQREPQDKKLGSPNRAIGTATPKPGISVDKNIRLIFFKGVRKHYNTKIKNTLRRTYEKIMEEYFSIAEKRDGKVYYRLLPSDQRPTFRQFSYWYRTYGNPIESLRMRSPRLYERSIRPFDQNVTLASFGPGTNFQVDATVADTYLVSSLNRNWIIGRPIVYIVKDLFSRMIVGCAVLLEGPSWLGAMIALENATADKVAFCRDYGIDITEDQWPCHHLEGVQKLHWYSMRNIFTS